MVEGWSSECLDVGEVNALTTHSDRLGSAWEFRAAKLLHSPSYPGVVTIVAKFFPVTPAVWNNRIISLGIETTLIYLYVLSNPHRFSEGLYRLPKAYVVADLHMDMEQVERAIKALEAEGLIRYDDSAEVVLDPQALHFLPPVSQRQIDGAITKLRQVPKTPLLQELWKLALAHNERLYKAMEDAFPQLSDDTFEEARHYDRHYEQQSHRGRQLGEGSEVRGRETTEQDQSFRTQ